MCWGGGGGSAGEGGWRDRHQRPRRTPGHKSLPSWGEIKNGAQGRRGEAPGTGQDGVREALPLCLFLEMVVSQKKGEWHPSSQRHW